MKVGLNHIVSLTTAQLDLPINYPIVPRLQDSSSYREPTPELRVGFAGGLNAPTSGLGPPTSGLDPLTSSFCAMYFLHKFLPTPHFDRGIYGKREPVTKNVTMYVAYYGIVLFSSSPPSHEL